MKKRASTISRTRSRSVMVRARRSGVSRAMRSGTRKTKTKSSSPQRATRSSGRMTTDHEQIRQWVEARGGTPALVKRTARGKAADGVLRIDFPGFSGAESLKPISWDEWFQVFDERRLGFLHQERTASGKTSRFNKLVCRR